MVVATSATNKGSKKEVKNNPTKITKVETKATEKKENNTPIEYKNALRKAKIYSDTMAMSQKSIYNQLISENGEKFSPEASQYAIENLKSDYNKNALNSAKTY